MFNISHLTFFGHAYRRVLVEEPIPKKWVEGKLNKVFLQKKKKTIFNYSHKTQVLGTRSTTVVDIQ